MNIYPADDKYSLLNRDNLRQTIQRQLSQKPKTFSQFLSPFLKPTLNFGPFNKRMTPIADVFPKLQTLKNVAEKISKKSSFRGHFDKQHAKGDQTLLKSEPHHLYQIY